MTQLGHLAYPPGWPVPSRSQTQCAWSRLGTFAGAGPQCACPPSPGWSQSHHSKAFAKHQTAILTASFSTLVPHRALSPGPGAATRVVTEMPQTCRRFLIKWSLGGPRGSFCVLLLLQPLLNVKPSMSNRH